MTTLRECRVLLDGTGLFTTLDDEELRALCEQSTTHGFAEGTLIVLEGETGDALYVVVTGRAQVFHTSRDGQEVVLAMLGPGEYFGEQALLGSAASRRAASAVAHVDTTVLRVPRAGLVASLGRDSPLRARLEARGERQARERLARQSVLFRSVHALGPGWAEELYFESETVVFNQGDPADRFYLILDGGAAVYETDAAGGARLLVRLREGQGFGELGLLTGAPRAATVVADPETRVLAVDGQRFIDLHAENPALRDYVQTLRNVYLLPGRGFTTQHAGRFMDRDCITTIYHLGDGRRAISSRVVGADIAHLALADSERLATTNLRYVDAERTVERSLQLADGVPVCAMSIGPWDELGEVYRLVLDATPLEAWRQTIFRETGGLRLEQRPQLFEDGEVVCGCMQSTRGQIREAIEAGATTSEQVMQVTGAGSVCGACRPRLNEMLGREDWHPVVVAAAEPVTDDVRCFRLQACGAPFQPALPGQHVILQAQIDGDWVQRSYTLSSPAAQTDHHEVTIKREPGGLFSPWLFERWPDHPLLRVSSPQGSYYLAADEPGPVVCMVAGIGVTPALAIARTVAEEARATRVHVHLSAAREGEAPGLESLTALAAGHPNITLAVRYTRAEGRLSPAEVAALSRDFAGALYFVCGPEAYETSMCDALAGAGVPEPRIRTETFIAAGNLHAITGGTEPTCPVAHGAPGAGADAEIVAPGYAPVAPLDAATEHGVLEEAEAFLAQFYHEKGVYGAFADRFADVRAEIQRSGTYWQTPDELAYGAKLAWRNSTRCVGRMFWQGLQVRDCRHLTTEEDMFAALVEHIRFATNGGNLRSLMTIFAGNAPGTPGIRIWNGQLLRYAGYRQSDGSVLGDPANAELTERALALGWPGGSRTPFDLLPIVIELPGREPRWFELPRDAVLEVPIVHPGYPWFAELGLKWYALPAVAEMLFDVGGVHYPAAPFNGWYMGTEIGARNLGDKQRYDRTPEVARRLALDTSSERSLWRDRALVEMNIAVLHSFQRMGVKMTDHHAASDDFMQFTRAESAAQRCVYGTWSWLVPPISGSATDVFHVEWEERILKPNYFYQRPAWERDQG